MSERSLVYAGLRRSNTGKRFYAWAPVEDVEHPLLFTAMLIPNPSIGTVYRCTVNPQGHIITNPCPVFEGVWPNKVHRAGWTILNRQSVAELSLDAVHKDQGDYVGELTLRDLRSKLFECDGAKRRVLTAIILDYLLQ